MGVETSDDAAVYQITDDIAMIQTVDFFTPVVDDPYLFGQVAASNSLSDVYAMGGEPKNAMNIVGFPGTLDSGILREILLGGARKAREAGTVLAGGHMITDEEPKYGLCVTGFVHPDRMWKNYGAVPGDVLILTKQIGSGIINTAIKAEMASKKAEEEAVLVMTSLNRYGREAAKDLPVHACTDITGFGLLGHCIEMASASEVSFELDVRRIAYMGDAVDFAKMGLVPAGAYKNRQHSGRFVDFSGVEEHYVDLLYDPQTSGGLLFSVDEKTADIMLRRFKEHPLDTEVSVIGRVAEKVDDKYIRFI